MKRIIFAGTPDIAAGILQALIDTNYSVIACLTQPDRPQGRGLKLTPSAVKVCAQNHNIPVLQPTNLKTADIQEQLRELKPDLMIVMAYGLILPKAVLEIPILGCINIHASVLPRWRGAAPIQYSILSGDLESGITIMQMDEGLDTGDILAIYKCKINATDTSEDLYNNLAKLGQTSCIDTLKQLASGTIHPIKQDNALATYAHKIDKQQAKINWQADSQEIDRCIRGYYPWPIAFTNFMGQLVRVWQAEIVEHDNKSAPGTILDIDKRGLIVATGNGAIRLLVLQFPGKKALPVASICNSNKNLIVGASFDQVKKLYM